MKLRIHLTLFEEGKNARPEVAARKRITLPFRIPFSLLLGFILGIFLHYILYRISLPSEPFIYVNF